MNKTLVCYFSASGVTKMVAHNLAEAVSGNLFEIEPVERYTEEDLDWNKENSRSSREMKDPNSRPKIVNKINLENYNTILLGFPIWWGVCPKIINTFLEENDFTDKSIFVFVTSGGSSDRESLEDLRKKYPNLQFVKSKRFFGTEKDEEYANWIR